MSPGGGYTYQFSCRIWRWVLNSSSMTLRAWPRLLTIGSVAKAWHYSLTGMPRSARYFFICLIVYLPGKLPEVRFSDAKVDHSHLLAPSVRGNGNPVRRLELRTLLGPQHFGKFSLIRAVWSDRRRHLSLLPKVNGKASGVDPAQTRHALAPQHALEIAL